MSYSALFNSGFRHAELAEEAKEERYQYATLPDTGRPSRSSSSSAKSSHRHRSIPPQGPIPSVPLATDPNLLYAPRRPFADTQSVRSAGSLQDDVMSVKSWNPPTNPHRRVNPSVPATPISYLFKLFRRSRRSIQPNGMLSPHHAMAPPRPRAPSAPVPVPVSAPVPAHASSSAPVPPWQHSRNEKRRSFSFLYMSDSPLDAAEEEEEEGSEHNTPQQHIYAQPISLPPTPPNTRPRRTSYASTTAAKRPKPAMYTESPSPATPSVVEQKRKQSVFSRLFHRKGK